MNPFNCSGEEAAFHAGKEAPTCYFCDAPIEDLRTIRTTDCGKPVCVACDDELQERIAQRRASLLNFMADLSVSVQRKSLNFHE